MPDNCDWQSCEAIAWARRAIRFLLAVIIAGLLVAVLCWVARLLLLGGYQSGDPPIIHGSSQ